ncbi:probable membrane-associated kinase regulator 4 [Solanum pennellii]|uniref:Probable membrane-associated kinase regulator 4 n=1 Tax=Solanum pennellii TaxID=28526 RepID=A0ABM1UWW1_SOLPN|nr:probable membrane-associated kinase regulator 4 [Solanum pennellii]
MAKYPLPSSMNYLDDEEYIDIEVCSYYYFTSSSPKNKEFEFQITNYNKENTISPADELFYRGKLLPLHQNIFQEEDLEDSFCINLFITPISSPSQTCMVSFELNPNDHKIISPKKLWSKFMIQHSLIIKKFKASRAFLKSLFSISSCTNDNCCSSEDIKVSKKKTSRWHSSTKCLSSSSTNGGSFSSSSNSSFNSNNTFTSEIVEGSIEAAIAHCKKSHK